MVPGRFFELNSAPAVLTPVSRSASRQEALTVNDVAAVQTSGKLASTLISRFMIALPNGCRGPNNDLPPQAMHTVLQKPLRPFGVWRKPHPPLHVKQVVD